MRVLVVTPWFPSARAPGSGLFNLRDVRLLARDHEVTVLHLIRPELVSEHEPADKAFLVERVPHSLGRPGTIPSASRRIRTMLRDADLVHSMAFSALPAMRLARPRVPWVHTEHFSQLITPASSRAAELGLGAMKRLFKYPTETIAVSRSLADVIDRYRGEPSTVIGNEVMMPIGPVPERRSEAEGSAPSRVRMIGVGGAVERKGPVTAVGTMIELRRRGVNASLTWVGEGDLAERMRETAMREGAADHLRMPGHLPPEELSRELLEADLFLLPVETETFGVAIAEALAHGLPVVTTGTGGHEEFLPAEASRLVGARAPGPLADAAQELLAAPDLWGRRRIAAYAAERFSPDARSAAYLEVYERALQAARGRRR